MRRVCADSSDADRCAQHLVAMLLQGSSLDFQMYFFMFVTNCTEKRLCISDLHVRKELVLGCVSSVRELSNQCLGLVPLVSGQPSSGALTQHGRRFRNLHDVRMCAHVQQHNFVFVDACHINLLVGWCDLFGDAM
eukprot:256764-Amphidinium_carterae.1